MAEIPLPARFRIVRRLGEGGMGIVYEALDVDRGVHVALKTIREPTADALARFKREFRALQDVSHPNLVTLGELVEHEGHWFFTMELIQGEEILSYVRHAPAFEMAALAGADTLEVAAGARMETRASDARRAASPVIRGAASDATRLRSVMRQLASALAALHEAGMVHRDVKPSNVRVDRTGRAVLLDFGLVLDLRSNPMLSATRLAGTPVYMAPEQATREGVGPEADWYAFGALLYEALTGIVPFEGAPFEVLMRKQTYDPTPPSTLVEGVPEDLEALCMALLRFEPAARPKQAAVLRALGGDDAGLRSRSHTEQAPFVGRGVELAALEDAFGAITRGAATAALVRGESGVGKSCLVQRFVAAKALEDPSVFVFAGRCYEREAVPYKAFDGVIDAMTRTLLSRRSEEVEGFYPTRPEALASVFPVLGRLPNFRRLVARRQPAADPQELRSRAFAALREMFERLTASHRVVVVVDDIQWADADSLALLAELVRPPDAPSLLLITTMRLSPETARDSDVSAERLASLFPGLRMIDVKRLSPEEGRNLARLLIQRWAPGAEGAAESIADGAEGHPLFIDALVHYGAALGERSGPLRLDEALVSHVAASGDTARLLVELLAVAGTPLRQEVLVTALGAERPEEFSRVVSALRVGHLVSISGGRAADAIELYHDRVRSAVLAHLDAASIASHHRALAVAFERVASTDAEALARHWRGAGEPKTAARHAETAARAAASALAFDRAADWYQVAIDLGAATDAAAGRELHERHGDALANAGRNALAAAAYRRASVGASAAGRLDLQRRAADQLLRGGHLDEGVDALSAVLATIGMKLPATPWLALLSVLWWRLWVAIRGLDFVPRDASEVAPSELTKVDACWSVSFGLAMADNIRGAAFQARHLALALATGEVRRVHRALVMEMPYVARGGVRTEKRLGRLIERTERITLDIGEPYAMGFYFAALSLAHTLVGRFRAALDASESAEVFLHDCAGTGSELANARIFALTALGRLGRLKELCRRQPAYAHDAVERGDIYAAVQFRVGHPSFRWIVQDDVERGRAETDEAMAAWSGRTFHTVHYYELFAHTYFDLYTGAFARARARILERWAPLRRSLLLLVQAVRLNALQMRASAAVALATQTKDRAELLASAVRDGRAIEREGAPWAVGLAKLVLAGAEAARGRDANAERMVRLLREASGLFDATGMAVLGAASRRTLGGLLGGDEGAAMVREADAWMRSETIASPEKVTRMMVPGFARD